jgi:hypothetical protein
MEEGMEKNVLKNAGFSRLVFAALAVLIAAGSCGGSLLNDGFADDWEEADKNVRIPLPASGRSLSDPNLVRAMVDYYEVIFLDSAKAAYYRGTASGAQRYLSVNVPVGTGYQVLLLAGNNAYGTLLATSYLNTTNIIQGRQTITLPTITKVTINPTLIKVERDSGTPVNIGTTATSNYRYIDLEKTDKNIKVTIDLAAQLEELSLANGGSLGGAFPIVQNSNELFLTPYKDTSGLGGPRYQLSGGLTFTPGVTGTGFSYPVIPDLANEDATYILYFRMQYQANFGTGAVSISEGRKWTITNGLDYTQPDFDNGIGGGLLVVVGNGGTAIIDLL